MLPKGLIPGTHRLGLRQFVDFDYLGQLTEAEREWLGNFADEYYRGGNHGIHPEALRKEQDAWRNRASEDVLGVEQWAIAEATPDRDPRKIARSPSPTAGYRVIHVDRLNVLPLPPADPLPEPIAALHEFARTLRPELGENRRHRPRAPHLERINQEIIALNEQLEKVS